MVSADRVPVPHHLVLVRHGATPSNERGRFQGWSGDGLSQAGQREVRRRARWLAVRLARRHFAPAEPPSAPELFGPGDVRVWSSDLLRCRQTARLVLPDARIVLDPRLRELCFGAFEGRTHVELMASEEPAYRAWLRDPAACPPPGGESLPALRARVLDWWSERIRPGPDSSGGTLVAVTHGGPAGILLGHLLRRGDPAAQHVPQPGGVVHLRREGPLADTWHVLDSRSIPSPPAP